MITIDLKGWIVVPLGLSDASLEQLRAEAYDLQPATPTPQGNVSLQPICVCL